MGVDSRGKVRGKCTSCDCDYYSSPDKGDQCGYCGHYAPAHVILRKCNTCNSCEQFADIKESPITCGDCKCSSECHEVQWKSLNVKLCKKPNCNRLCLKEGETVYEYCGRKHAAEHCKALGVPNPFSSSPNNVKSFINLPSPDSPRSMLVLPQSSSPRKKSSNPSSPNTSPRKSSQPASPRQSTSSLPPTSPRKSVAPSTSSTPPTSPRKSSQPASPRQYSSSSTSSSPRSAASRASTPSSPRSSQPRHSISPSASSTSTPRAVMLSTGTAYRVSQPASHTYAPYTGPRVPALVFPAGAGTAVASPVLRSLSPPPFSTSSPAPTTRARANTGPTCAFHGCTKPCAQGLHGFCSRAHANAYAVLQSFGMHGLICAINPRESVKLLNSPVSPESVKMLINAQASQLGKPQVSQERFVSEPLKISSTLDSMKLAAKRESVKFSAPARESVKLAKPQVSQEKLAQALDPMKMVAKRESVKFSNPARESVKFSAQGSRESLRMVNFARAK